MTMNCSGASSSPLLERRNYTVQSTDSGEAGIKLAGEAAFDLIITDMGLPGISGLETIKQMRRRKPDIKILAVSGSGRSKGDFLDEPGRLGADAPLAKPFEPGGFSSPSPDS
jgi:CheY-like chemotaxis protein